MFGSKIDNLITLRDAGVDVPEFEVVRFGEVIDNQSAFAAFFQEQLSKKPAEASQNIHDYLADHLSVDPVICLDADYYAVRSASNLEDGAKDSFAGQFQTYLRVRQKDLLRRIYECFMSLASENVIAYIQQKTIEPDNIEMNVIVQRMVNSELSGVIFTSNPQGLLNEAVITVGKGLGENVVSEKTVTTSYYYHKTDQTYYYEGSTDYLTPRLVEKLMKVAMQLEELLGHGLDIEFSIVGEKVYILQARKITTLNFDHPLIMDNSNIVESYPGLSLPLTISFAEMIYQGVFTAQCRRFVQDEKIVTAQHDVLANMVGSYNGRLYYTISNWYYIINYLPLSSRIIPLWEEMLGLQHEKQTLGRQNLRIKARVAKNYVKELRHIEQNMAELNSYFLDVEERFNEQFNERLTISESMKMFHTIADELFSRWDLTLLNDIYTFINVGLLKKKLGNGANKVISRISNLESMKPVAALINLAYDKDKIPPDEYQTRFAAYIAKYGDRNVEELKLESKTFRTNPELLEARVAEYRKDMARLEKLHRSVNASPSNSGDDNRLLRRCKAGIRHREISRLNRSRIFGIARRIMLHVGHLLEEHKAIDDYSDVFYLTVEELDKYAKHSFDVREQIEKRKADYEMYAKLPAYSKLFFADAEFNKHHHSINTYTFNNEKDAIIGTPCSDGEVTGKVIFVDDPKNQPDTDGKIIITRSTDPGWVFILSTAKGVISERGSLLSHTAIISRELGLPSIVGVKNLTKILHDGDKISMNGQTGEIKIVKRAEP